MENHGDDEQRKHLRNSLCDVFVRQLYDEPSIHVHELFNDTFVLGVHICCRVACNYFSAEIDKNSDVVRQLEVLFVTVDGNRMAINT